MGRAHSPQTITFAGFRDRLGGVLDRHLSSVRGGSPTVLVPAANLDARGFRCIQGSKITDRWPIWGGTYIAP